MSKAEEALEALRARIKYNSKREDPYMDPDRNKPFEEMEDAPKMQVAPPEGDMTSGLPGFIERMKKKRKKVALGPDPEDITPGLPND